MVSFKEDSLGVVRGLNKTQANPEHGKEGKELKS
jgi:hypothetical protein